MVITDIIYIMLINILVDFHHLLLFWFSLFYTLKFLIHFFFKICQLYASFSPLGGPEKLEYSVCKLVGLPTKCSIELLVFCKVEHCTSNLAGTKILEIELEKQSRTSSC